MENLKGKNSIKNIIFDLGGVIMDIDFNRTIEAFKDLGAENFEQLFSWEKQVNLFNKMDRGEVSPGEFRNEIRSITGLNISDQQIDDAWMKILSKVPYSRIQLLREVKGNYNSYLLSNTNMIHMENFRQDLQVDFGVSGIEVLFDRSYLSYEVGMRKPEKRIFEHVIENNNLDVSEILFIDDTPQHIESASSLGINTYLFKPGEERLEGLFENGVLTGMELKGMERR